VCTESPSDTQEPKLKHGQAHTSRNHHLKRRGELISAETYDGFITEGWINWLYTRLALMEPVPKSERSPIVHDSKQGSDGTEDGSAISSSEKSESLVRPPSVFSEGHLNKLTTWDEYLNSEHDE
jgi:hypothetical protein